MKSQLVSAPATTFTIPNLQVSSAYKIQVSSLLGDREGSPALVTARTRESLLDENTVVFCVAACLLQESENICST